MTTSYSGVTYKYIAEYIPGLKLEFSVELCVHIRSGYFFMQVTQTKLKNCFNFTVASIYIQEVS